MLNWENIVSLERSAAGEATSARFIAFNTGVELVAYGPAAAAEERLRRAMADCRAYERLFSRTIPSSDVGRLNAAGGEAVRIDARTADLLQKAIGYCEASEGVFDITVGPLVAAWDFKNGIVADEAALKEAAQHVGWQKLGVQAQCGGNWFARLSDPAAQIDLGGIAKGWIADALGRTMLGGGVEGALINLGGNVLALGSKPDGSPWKLGIREPKASDAKPGVLFAIEVAEGALVTSGVYERGFDRDGVRFHHILDPRTGHPIATPWASVSVLTDKAIDAEGFSTTLLALGLKGSRHLARSHLEIRQAYFAAADGAIDLLRP